MDILNNIFIWNDVDIQKKKKLISRPKIYKSKKLIKQVKEIISNIKKNGDEALYFYSKLFDKVNFKNFLINRKTILESSNYVEAKLKKAMMIAFNNIKKFHIAQQSQEINVEINKGINCKLINRPINSVGLYIPGGSAPLFSTVLMLTIPANIAGCKEIIICSPPPISNLVLYAAKICNVKKIFQIGGAHAISAMAFGTESIPKVDKIFGPGNIWVTEAKRQVSYRLDGTDIDMLAGPSELLIIADQYAHPKFIAADLLSQAEHGEDSQVILLTDNLELAKSVVLEIKKQLPMLSRYLIIKKSLMHSRIIVTKNLKESILISNQYSPEHLIINTKNAHYLLNQINNAGSVFIGNFSPESAGDYASGTNHVLPTYGYTKTYSGISIHDFQKKITVQELNYLGLKSLSSTIKILSNAEKMTAHKNAVQVRI